MHNFQQDGHMAFVNPVGRANYEPNSWGGEAGGPREDPETGFTTFADGGGDDLEKRRVRPELFADHYSQARQFYVSQTEVERQHIASAFVFELSKVETPPIRRRMVANLRNVDEDLAATVAGGLGIELPARAKAARAAITDLAESPALSILRNGPESFEGRKLGVLVTDGADAGIVAALTAAVKKEGALIELVGPTVEGVTASDGSSLPVKQKIDGGPSVLYDAVAIVTSAEGAAKLAGDSTTRDFVSDAYAHCKFIGFVPDAVALLEAVGVADDGDDGVVSLDAKRKAAGFVQQCGELRVWDREPRVDRT
jgi:catalase